MTMYEVVVEGTGIVYKGDDFSKAYPTYEDERKAGVSAGRRVTLLVDGEVGDVYTPD